MNIRQHLLIGLTACLLAAPVLAVKIDMEPGLWEHKMTVNDSELQKAMEEARKQLANMPAAQRKMMEDMLAAQGIGIGADGTTVKVCMTKEMIERGQLPKQNQNCNQEIVEAGKNRYNVVFSCDDQSWSGISKMHFLSKKEYTGETRVIQQQNGKKEEQSITQTGKWLSADCGNIKPPQYD